MTTTKTDMTLWALARCPFLSADDLALLYPLHPRAARARLLRLCRRGLADCIQVPRTQLHLYYLTAAGITAAAGAAETDSQALAARYGLGDRLLLRRLPSLDRLCAGRRVLVALHHALAAQGGLLQTWRAWPVSWPYLHGTQRRLLHLDGEGTLRLPGALDGDWSFGFLWDGDGTTPSSLLRERLAQYDALCHARALLGPDAAAVPPLLLVTAAPARVPTGYRPDLLWTTDVEITQQGILDAPWRGSSTRGEGLSLPAALGTLGTAPADTLVGIPLSRAEGRLVLPGQEGHVRLQQRLRAARHAGEPEESLPLLTLALPPRSVGLLTVVGQHPLLAARDIADAAHLSLVDARGLLGLLQRHGLVTTWLPPRTPRLRRTRRHALTTRGLRLLALRAGVAPDTYRRSYGVLDDAGNGHGHSHGLAFARANLAHTDGINRVYLTLVAAARAAHGEVQWRGEWACTHVYQDGRHLRTLRPDAEGTYTDSTGTLHFYLEVDRGTTRLWRLAAKLAQYYAYRSSSGGDQITLLLVTNGPERGREALRLNETLAGRMETGPLDLHVTTSREVAEHRVDPHIWCVTSGPVVCVNLPSIRYRPLSDCDEAVVS